MSGKSKAQERAERHEWLRREAERAKRERPEEWARVTRWTWIIVVVLAVLVIAFPWLIGLAFFLWILPGFFILVGACVIGLLNLWRFSN